MAFDDDLVGVPGLLGVETPEADVIDDEEVGGEQATQDSFRGVIGPGLVNELEQGVSAEEEDAAA